MQPVTRDALDGYLGKNISELCPNRYTSAADNHCAHFVSHVLGFRFGLTCGNMGHGPGPSANIRVRELFPKCPMVGNWSTKPVVLIYCLVFITNANNVNLQTKTMVNVSRKHVGIYYNGTIWHYSNSRRQVVSQTPEAFSKHYPAPNNAMFYGTMPFVLNL
jgi:hypothetical protein